jgi:hypothetical protein
MKNWAIKANGNIGVVRYTSEGFANRAVMEMAEEVFGDAVYTDDDPKIDAYLNSYEVVQV